MVVPEALLAHHFGPFIAINKISRIFDNAQRSESDEKYILLKLIMNHVRVFFYYLGNLKGHSALKTFMVLIAGRVSEPINIITCSSIPVGVLKSINLTSNWEIISLTYNTVYHH